MNSLNYKEVFNTIVEQTAKYVTDNDLKAMVLGISGGIDSTVVAAICYEVSILTGVPLIGRSLPTKFNKDGETSAATLVGEAFCNDFKEVHIQDIYANIVDYINDVEADYGQTKLANGNIQARIRMLYLYNLAGVHQGMVMDTDNLTENNLGYFTIHGDVGDYNPIGGLWKTEVFKLAEFLVEKYSMQSHFFETYDIQKSDHSDYARCNAVAKSLKLKPTAGLGITNDDLEELGAESYDQVDSILHEILCWKWIEDQNPSNPKERYQKFMEDQQMLNIPIEVIKNVAKRHFYSTFKRKRLPIKIDRETII
jgi:NAD+ synthetase